MPNRATRRSKEYRAKFAAYQANQSDRLEKCHPSQWRDMYRGDGSKRQIGLGDKWATELFPPDADVVNVANMRHLWILTEPPSYGWKGRL